jgi:O-antigen/teichoic acid export membrane protein
MKLIGILQKWLSVSMKKDLRLSSIKVVGLITGFALQVFLTKVIGVKEYGLFVLFTTWTNFLSLILILGYDRTIIKQLGYFYIQRDKGKFRSTLDKLMLVVFLNSLIFLLIAFFIPHSFLIKSFFSKDLLESTWLLIAVGTVTFTLFDALGKVLSAVQRVELTILRSEVIYKFILFIIVAILFIFLRNFVGVNIIVLGVISAHLLTLLILLFIFDRKKIKQYLTIEKERIALGNENFVFFFTGLNYYAINQIDKIFLGKVESLETLGVYGLVTTLIGIMSFSTIVYQRFLPKISNYFRTNDIKGLEKEFKTVCRNSLIIALPFIMFILVYTNDILLFFGKSYTTGVLILRVLIWGQMMNFLTGPCGNLLIHGRHAKIDLINSIAVLFVTIVLVIVGYKYYGVLGVAAATSFGMMLINIVKVIEVKIFYKIFPYEIKNILLTLIVFISFFSIKLIHINIQSLVFRLFTNFGLSLLATLAVIAVFYLIQKIKYKKKTIVPVFYESIKAEQV